VQPASACGRAGPAPGLSRVAGPDRVCLLTSSHPVTYSRFFDRQACSLARAGYQVTLVGLGEKDNARETGGVKLVTVPEERLAGKLRNLRRISRIAGSEQARLYECLDPWTLALGLRLKQARPELRIVYDSSEWFSRAFLERSDLPLALRIAGYAAIEAIEQKAARQADAILETNRSRARRFLRRGRRVTLVENFPPSELLPEPSAERRRAVVWTGLISRHRGFDRLLPALAGVIQRVPDARLEVLGEFDPRDSLEPECCGLLRARRLEPAVEFAGWLPYRQMLRRCASALVGVILLQPRRTNDYTGLPNKLFEFMGCGLAVVAADFPEMRRKVQETGCGWLVDPTDEHQIGQVLSEALANPDECVRRGLAGRTAVLDRYHWSVAEERLLRCYRKLLR